MSIREKIIMVLVVVILLYSGAHYGIERFIIMPSFTAPQRAEAVKESLGRTFDLIFMGIQMPLMSGYEATRILRSKGVQTAIVALTAYAMNGDARHMCAVRLSKKAACIEQAGRDEDINTAALHFGDIQGEVDKFLFYLSQENCMEIAKQQT